MLVKSRNRALAEKKTAECNFYRVVQQFTIKSFSLRDHGSLETWSCENLLKFNKVRCKVLLMSWGSPQHKCREDGEWIEYSPKEKG